MGADLALPRYWRPPVAVAVPHVSCSPRRTPYNRALIAALNRAGFATLLFDCFTSIEKVGSAVPTDIGSMTQRVLAATQHLRGQPGTPDLAIGYLATGIASAAALCAAARLGESVGAVVSLGARGDFDEVRLECVTAPVLLIVGGNAEDLEGGVAIRERLRCPNDLVVVPGGTSLCDGDPGPHKRAFRLAIDWFTIHLRDSGRRA